MKIARRTRLSTQNAIPLSRKQVLAALSNSPVLGALDPSDREALAGSTRAVQLGAQQLLWSHGQRADHVGLVLAGRLKVTRQLRQREVIVELVGPGDLVGDVALSLHRSYQFDVSCLRRARVLLVPMQVVSGLLEQRPKACVALAFDLANQVLKLSRRVEALTAVSVEQRLARVLVSLVDRFGEPFPGGTLVPLKLRREDFASLAATTLESASRRLSAWNRSGIVRPQPAGFLVRDLAALHRIVEAEG